MLIASSQLSSQLTDKSGSNALHCAALNGHSNIIKVLATAKVDINLQRRDGWTPLHLACWNGHVDTVRELLAVHCKVNVRTDSGMGPLHLAAAKEHNEIVKELLDAGVAPDMQDKVRIVMCSKLFLWITCHLVWKCPMESLRNLSPCVQVPNGKPETMK